MGGSKKKSDKAIKLLIDEGLKGTSVTVVLIGAEKRIVPTLLMKLKRV